MTNISEIRNLVNFLDEGEAKYILLHVVSSYPLEERHSKLFQINDLKKNFNCPIGHSDHTAGTLIPPLAVAAGAQIIEKHFTLNKNAKGPDHLTSLNFKELNYLSQALKKTSKALGSFSKKLTQEEKKNKKEFTKRKISDVLQEAFKDKSYKYLILGFFVCGLHVALISNYLPVFANMSLSFL